ncbi:MAG TPA: lipopolysaccharide biosynthesis protein [Pirellulales bacterium]|nr:lipopolysaccharide biosynthesis protein [Pirellulales bacterium]
MSPRPQLKTDTLASGVAMLLALTVAQRLVGFARGILFCRWLDVDQLGQWDLAYGFLMLAAPLVVLGLPGSLGRYAEYYRQRGRLKPFLRRTGGGTGLFALVAAAAVAWRRDWLAEVFFNDRRQGAFVALLAVVLMTWIVHTLLVAVFNSLRMTRAVSLLQFCNSLAFAAIGVALLVGFEASARCVVWSFAAAATVSSCVGLAWLFTTWRRIQEEAAPLVDARGEQHLAWRGGPGSSIWRQVLPFAAWVWITNALANTFGLADRWMLIHFSGLSEPAAMEQVGQYHSARVVSLLFLGVAEMIAGLATPHLAHDWEAGRREEVSQKMNLILKLLAMSLYAASVGLLVASPLLFGLAWAGKYATGIALLPWTLIYCAWGSLAVVATNYLWCAERARLASLSLLSGLMVTVALNAWLLPTYGVFGTAWATTAANFVMLALMYLSAWSCGMRFHCGTLIVAAAPVAIAGGPYPAVAVLAGLVVAACRGNWLLTLDEQQTLAAAAKAAWRRCVGAGWAPPDLAETAVGDSQPTI